MAYALNFQLLIIILLISKRKVMKSIFTLLLSTLFSVSLLAYDGTRLTISTVTNMKMRVEIDGRRYNMDNKGISVRDLSAGYHTVKIYRDSKKGNGVFNNNRQELVYNSSVYLRRDYHLDITINRFGKAMVDERRIDRNDDWYDDDDNYDRNNPRDDRDYRRDNRGNRRDDYTGQPMNDHEFNQAKETLRREWLESSRLNSARQLLTRNFYTTRQVREILQLFNFENNKLELAKHAYGRTTDKRNYHLVNDLFSNSSRDELARYIRDYR